VGGEVLQLLAASHPDLIIRALVRDGTKAAAVSAVSDKVEMVNGTLDDVDIIAREAANADVVLSTPISSHIRRLSCQPCPLPSQISRRPAM
jgi:uncharacterized protein YbjT (DUF2867 family)